MKNSFTRFRVRPRFRPLLLLTALLLAGLTAHCQTTWTGATDSEWTTPTNWSAGVPGATTDVTIPDVTTDPVVTTAVGAGSIRINPGGRLTISAGASLTLTPVTNQNFVNGTLINHGRFTVTADTTIQDCLYNTGTVQNKPTGTIRLNGAFGNGFWNQTDNSSLTNEGTIIVGDALPTASTGILNVGTLINTATGTILIDRSQGNALTNTKILTNAGLIRIGTNVPPLVRGILNLRTIPANPLPVFTNLACGIIEAFGIVVNLDGDFLNEGLLRVNTTKNYLTTVVRVNSPGGVAGKYAFAPAGFGGSTVGLNLTANAVFVEDGTAPTTDGCQALTNAAQLMGKIALIDRGNCDFGVKCLQAEQAGAIAVIVFNNVGGGLFTMGAGTVGNQVTIPCVLLSQADGVAIRTALASNPVNIGFNQEVESTVPLTNNGVIEYPQGNPIPNVTNNDVIVAPVGTCGSVVVPALQLGGSNSFTVGSTWYKDPALTQVAGTYQPGINAFTATNLPAGSTTTLYFAATDNVNGCTRTVSVAVTLGTQGEVSVDLFPATPGRLCQGDPLPVTFSTTGSCGFAEGKTYPVQLSNATGSFANPLVLGVAQPGTTVFPASALAGLPPGTGYRVRIVNGEQNSPASLPFRLEGPTLNLTPGVGGAPVCRGNAVTVSFTLAGCPFPEGNAFTAQLSSASGSFANPVSLGTVVPGVANSVTIPVTSAAGTGYRIRVVSSQPQLTSLATSPFRVNATGCTNGRLSAEEAQVVVAPNPARGSEIRVRVSGMDNPGFSLSTTTGRSVGISVQPDGSGEFVLTLRQALPVGVYVLQASEGTTRLTSRVLVSE